MIYSLAKERIISDRPSMLGSEAFSFRQVISSITSPHVIMMFCACFASGTTVYGLALFLPTIVSKLGFSSIHTQLLSVGPFASGFVCKNAFFLMANDLIKSIMIIVTLFVSYFSDKYQNRTIPICLCAVIATIGYIVFFGKFAKGVIGGYKLKLKIGTVSNSVAMSYGSLFLSVSGAYALAPVTSAWIANNSEPHYRRATSIALAFMATNSVSDLGRLVLLSYYSN